MTLKATPKHSKYHALTDAPQGSFAQEFAQLPIHDLATYAGKANKSHVERVFHRGPQSLEDFAALLSPEAGERLEEMALQSQRLTRQHFGRAVRLFAPLYLSNECVNVCRYCGFSRTNAIPRITLAPAQVLAEAEKLSRQGFRHLLLVAGEHPKFVSNGYVEQCVRDCLPMMPEVALELGPLEVAEYAPLAKAGAAALIAYQETYHLPSYEALHTAGPKKYYAWRMDTPQRGAQAGFRRLGIGALLGLYDWRYELLAVAAHARYLLRTCWRANVSISLPRMRPAAGGWQPDPGHTISDRELVQVICALRMFLPNVGFTLSTREPPHLRDGLIPLGVTLMSAGSSTEPGGYASFDETTWTPTREQEGEQFHIADERSPAAIAQAIRAHRLDPVWKDYDIALATSSTLPAPNQGRPSVGKRLSTDRLWEASTSIP